MMVDAVAVAVALETLCQAELERRKATRQQEHRERERERVCDRGGCRGGMKRRWPFFVVGRRRKREWELLRRKGADEVGQRCATVEYEY